MQLFSPQLLNGSYHESLGALYSNAQTAEIFGCESSTIRSQKKRLTDCGELTEGKHWLEKDGKTFWSFEGTCLLGLTLSTQLAQQFRLAITELLSAWQQGAIAIVPTGNGITIQTQQGALPVATQVELPDPVAIGEAIALARYEQTLQAWKDSVAAVVQGKEQALAANSSDRLGKYLVECYGVNPL